MRAILDVALIGSLIENIPRHGLGSLYCITCFDVLHHLNQLKMASEYQRLATKESWWNILDGKRKLRGEGHIHNPITYVHNVHRNREEN